MTVMLSKKTKSLFTKVVESFLQDIENNINEKNANTKFELLEMFNYDDEYFTKKEVCSIYKISETTLERYVRNGLEYSSKSIGCSRKFKKSNVENFINLKTKNHGR